MVDLSHLNEKGFWDVAALSDAPLVATHSNVHAICPSPRNLTDRQLDAIRRSDGMVGLNFHIGFLRPDGNSKLDAPLELMVQHIDYLVERLGIERVGFGSGFRRGENARRNWRRQRAAEAHRRAARAATTTRRCASWRTRTGCACCAKRRK